MSTRHRVALALQRGAQITDFRHETFKTGNTMNYVFRDPATARIMAEMLRTIFKSNRKPLLHKGRKP